MWVVPHYWLLPTSKIPLLPWLQGELPKSVSVYLVALMELLALLVLPPRLLLTEVRAAAALCSDHSLLMPVNELAWPHSASSTTEKMRWITRTVIVSDERHSTSGMKSCTGSLGNTGSLICCAICRFFNVAQVLPSQRCCLSELQ